MQFISFILFSTVLFLFGCKPNQQQNGKGESSKNQVMPAASQDTLVLDSDGEFTVDKGAIISFLAFENPSTGSTWNLVKPSGKSPIRLISDDFVSLEKNPEIVGAGGERKWLFAADKIGKDSIVLWHGRSWETQRLFRRFSIIIR